MTVFGVDDYEDYWRDRKSIKRTGATRIHRRIVELLERYVPAGGRMLDCGVGPAIYFRILRSKNFEMYGIEFSEEALTLYDFDTSTIKIADLNKTIPDFGFKFDAAVASMIVHHLNDPAAFIANLANQLKPSGVALVVHPNLVYYKHRLRLLSGQFPKFSPSHRVFLIPNAVEELITKAGLSILEIGRKKNRPFPHLLAPELFYVCRRRA